MYRSLAMLAFLALNTCQSQPNNPTWQESSTIQIGKARFTVIAPECIRMEYSESGKFIDSPSVFAINRDIRSKNFKLNRKENEVIIDTGQIRLIYNQDGKPFNPNNLNAFIKNGTQYVEWKPGLPNHGNLGGTLRSLDLATGAIPLGEGVLSRDGWYLLDDSKRPLLINDWPVARQKTSDLDWYLFGYGHDYKSALRVFTGIGGAVPMPRKYVLGTWYSRYWDYSSKDYRDIVKEFESHDFPLDVMVISNWHENWVGFSWDPKLIQEPPELLKWLNEQRIFTTLNLHPCNPFEGVDTGIASHEKYYEAFMKEIGKDPSSGKTIIIDVGDKKCISAFFKHILNPLEKEGVNFWWFDGGWGDVPSISGLGELFWFNRCFYQDSNRGSLRGQSFSRWGGWGDHRHPIHFSGDAYSKWPVLAFEVPLTSTAGNVGCFFWSHDIGGYRGPRNDELFARWIQFGATTSALRLHSVDYKDLDRRPWLWDKSVEQSARKAFHLRSILFPYIYSSAWQGHKESLPLNRPMYIEYPEEPKAYQNPQQYLFGSALLVAPITSPGAGPKKVATQAVWFPKGTWYNWFTGEKYNGGTEELVCADLNEFPLYAKGGIPIPLQPYTQRMTTEPLNTLVIRSYPGKEGSYELYEDDGITKDYLRGQFATTKMKYRRDGNTVTITTSPTNGRFQGQTNQRSYIFELPCTRKAIQAEVDGQDIKFEYDEKTSTNRIHVPSRPIQKGIILKVNAEEIDYKHLQQTTLMSRLKGIMGDIPSGQSFQDILLKCVQKESDHALIETLLSLGGIGVQNKNLGVYMGQQQQKMCLYNNAALVSDRRFHVSILDQSAGKKKKLSVRDYEADKIPIDISIPNIPLSTAPWLGARMDRFIQLDLAIKGNPISFSKIIDQGWTYIDKWNIVGPFELDKKRDLSVQKFAPEEKPIDLKDEYIGAGGKKVHWKKAQTNFVHFLDLNGQFNENYRIAYALVTLDSEKAQDVILRINSDDGVEVWLNGEKLHSISMARFFHDDPDIVKATFKKGNNQLLLKVSQYVWMWGFKVGVESSHPIKISDP